MSTKKLAESEKQTPRTSSSTRNPGFFS